MTPYAFGLFPKIKTQLLTAFRRKVLNHHRPLQTAKNRKRSEGGTAGQPSTGAKCDRGALHKVPKSSINILSWGEIVSNSRRTDDACPLRPAPTAVPLSHWGLGKVGFYGRFLGGCGIVGLWPRHSSPSGHEVSPHVSPRSQAWCAHTETGSASHKPGAKRRLV